MALIESGRLKAILLNTGLQQKDQPLYQFLNSLIDKVVALSAAANSSSGGGGGGSTVTNINNIIQQIISGDGDGGNSGDTIPGPPGNTGADGANGMVPYSIALGETFTVPVNKQALFAMNIDNSGTLVVDGFLIEVD
jgi:hypothetical protein